jgi:hypothetical protein
LTGLPTNHITALATLPNQIAAWVLATLTLTNQSLVEVVLTNQSLVDDELNNRSLVDDVSTNQSSPWATLAWGPQERAQTHRHVLRRVLRARVPRRDFAEEKHSIDVESTYRGDSPRFRV